MNLMAGTELIRIERERQISEEGYTTEHDDSHDKEELALAAACYAAPSLIYLKHEFANAIRFSDPWPWDIRDDKRKYKGNTVLPNNTSLTTNQRVILLAKAGALIAAELDRLLRSQK